MKFVAMIPCRLGSQRIPKKNLRLLAGKTLSQWVAKACLETGLFSEVYINSEAPIFGKIAKDVGAKFYQRPDALSTNSATNDDFALDFMNKINCEILVQVNPTSPFLTSENIKTFLTEYSEGNFQTLHTVKAEKIEGLFEGKPLNFNPMKQMPPSQLLTPVHVFSSSIMAWDTNKFRENMKTLGAAVYGGDGKIGYHILKGFATLDIDNEEDFLLAEAIAKMMEMKSHEKKYYEI